MRRKLKTFCISDGGTDDAVVDGVQVLAEGVQVEAVQTTEGTDCTVLPEETDAEETSRSEMQKPDAKKNLP